jgi:hypothetical protein
MLVEAVARYGARNVDLDRPGRDGPSSLWIATLARVPRPEYDEPGGSTPNTILASAPAKAALEQSAGGRRMGRDNRASFHDRVRVRTFGAAAGRIRRRGRWQETVLIRDPSLEGLPRPPGWCASFGRVPKLLRFGDNPLAWLDAQHGFHDCPAKMENGALYSVVGDRGLRVPR